jgi:hypothetical protein
MLCIFCEEHFQHESDKSVEYLRLKPRLVSLARAHLHDQSQVKSLESDLKRYQQAVLIHKDTTLKSPCPWYSDDLSSMSWQHPERFEESEYYMQIWKVPLEGFNVRLGALAGCQLCRRLYAIISHMPEFGHISTVRFESWLHFHRISFRPLHILFLARRPFHHEWLYLRIIDDQTDERKPKLVQ